MCENVNPKVIVDDDFLDLRNVQSRPSSRRPMSAHSITKGSSSINTEGKARTVKEVLPGLQRFLNNYNRKNSAPFGYQKNNRDNSQPVDCRFRRKIENKTLSSRSESILQENVESRKETLSTEVSSHDHSSESGKKNEVQVQNKPLETAYKKPNCLETKSPRSVSPFKTKGDSKSFRKMKRYESNDQLNDGEKECEKDAGIMLNYVQQDIKSSTERKRNIIEDNVKLENTKIYNRGEFLWDNTKFESSCGFDQLPTFKKSWTVPSLPLTKNKFSWTTHYNALCAKVDRKTYEFDTDDTISDSEDQLSAYSSISRNNYMNLIFCLGCLCGIFLIGGILTASEINAEYFRPLESDEGMFEFFYVRISSTFRLVLSVLQQILTLPSSQLFRTNVEQTRNWNVLSKYVYFIPE